MPTSLRRQALYRWAALLGKRFPPLSRCQAFGLALWSIGIVLARAASLHAVTLALALWLGLNPLNLLKRLHEWYLEASAKKGSGTGGTGQHRRDWQPREVQPYLLRWIVEGWPDRQLVLALDPTNLQDRFHVLSISVLYRRCAVPVIWTVVRGNQPEAWEPHWERMLGQLAAQLGGGWQVLVLADRGAYSPRLFRCLVRLGWHPFLRIRAQGSFRPRGRTRWRDLAAVRPSPGRPQAWRARVFKNEPGRLEATLLACQEQGCAEPWLIVTDLDPEVARASWYGLRAWIEQGFKQLKGEGWKVSRTRIDACARLERQWLAVAVATLWVLQVGGQSEAADDAAHADRGRGPRPDEVHPALPDLSRRARGRRQRSATRPATRPATQPKRIWAVFGRGWNLLRNALAVGVVLLGGWHPEAWPEHPGGGLPATAPASPGATAGRLEHPGTANPQPAGTSRAFDSS